MPLEPPIASPVLALLSDAGRNAQRAAVLLRDLVVAFPERADLAAELVTCEHAGDRITHDIIYGLNAGHGDGARGLDARDGHRLATAIDDVVDFAEQAADELVLYRVEAPMEQAAVLADVLVRATDELAGALGCLERDDALTAHLLAVHRLEDEGDRVSRAAVASLFATGIDPMVVIRWKDIFETLEQAVDACETVAHVLEGVALKRRR